MVKFLTAQCLANLLFKHPSSRHLWKRCTHHTALSTCQEPLKFRNEGPCVELAVPSVKGTHMWYLYTKSFVLLELSPGFKLHHFIFWLPILVHGSCSVIQLPHESLAFIRLCHRTACKTPPDVPSQRSTAPFLLSFTSQLPKQASLFFFFY